MGSESKYSMIYNGYIPFLWTSAQHPKIKNAIFNNPATIVFWEDGTKTVVKVQHGDTYDKELGLALCCAKKLFGNKSNFNNQFKKFLQNEKK